MTLRTSKLLISLIIDNSATMKGEKFNRLKAALDNFTQAVAGSEFGNLIEYSIIGFEALHPKVYKGFMDDCTMLTRLSAGGIPLLPKTFNLALSNLETRVDELRNAGMELFKPWLVVLTDGKSFGDFKSIIEKLNTLKSSGQLTYFPFLLSDMDIDDSLNDLFKFMRPMPIINYKYEELFKWIFNTAKARIHTPLNQGFSLNPQSFDGWVKR